jgi:hypothetical protein
MRPSEGLFSKLKEQIMKHLLSMLIVVLVSPLFGATLQEDCYEARRKVIGCLETYDCVRVRNNDNQKQFQLILNRGYLNRTLQSEITRDEHYLELSTAILHRLSHLKEKLESVSRRYDNFNLNKGRKVLPKIKVLAKQHGTITDILSQIQTLLKKHEDIIEQTLIPNNNRPTSEK